MATISQAEINRLKYKTWMSDADITAQLQSKGYTLPTTTQEAGVSIPWFQQTTTPTQTNTQTTQPTGSVSSILGELGAEDPFINRYTQEQLGLYNTPIDENAIRKQKESEFQAQIDAINAVYADKLRQEKLVGQGRIGSSRAIQARSGLIGSDFGTAQTWQVQQLNKEQEAAIESERLALVNQILTQARESAASEIAAKRQAREAGGKAYLEYLAGQQTRKQENTSRAAQLLLLNNKTPEDISDAELAQARISRNDLRLAYSGIKSQQEAEQAKAQAEQEKAALEALKTQSEIDKNQADIINEALKTGRVYEQGGFIFDGATNQLIGSAQAVRRAGVTWGGWVGVGIVWTGWTQQTIAQQPWFKKLRAKEQTQALALDNLTRELNKYKQIISEADIGEYGVELFGKNAGLIESQLNALLFAAAQAEWTGALQAADRQVLEKVIPNPTTLTGAFTSLKSGGLEWVYAKIDNQIRKYEWNLANLWITPTSTYQVPTPPTNAPAWEDAYAKYLESWDVNGNWII